MKLVARVLLLLLMFIVLKQSVSLAQEEYQPDLQYVVTRNDISYSVDMNSVRFLPKTMVLFWMVSDNLKTNTTLLSQVVVNPDPREYRYEEGVVLDKTKNVKSRITKPSEWYSIGKNSVMEIVVNYIIENYSTTNNNQ